MLLPQHRAVPPVMTAQVCVPAADACVTPLSEPVPIAGNVRGPDIGDLAVEITAQNFYSKTFTIEHH